MNLLTPTTWRRAEMHKDYGRSGQFSPSEGLVELCDIPEL